MTAGVDGAPCYRVRSFQRCGRTGSSIHRTCLYTAGRWIAEHITVSAPDLDEPPHASLEDHSSNTDPRRYAQ